MDMKTSNNKQEKTRLTTLKNQPLVAVLFTLSGMHHIKVANVEKSRKSLPFCTPRKDPIFTYK